MKQLLIKRILHILSCNGGGTPGDMPSFNNMRWRVVAETMYTLAGGDANTKAFKKALPNLHMNESDLEKLSDEQLVNVFELVVRRANVCM